MSVSSNDELTGVVSQWFEEQEEYSLQGFLLCWQNGGSMSNSRDTIYLMTVKHICATSTSYLGRFNFPHKCRQAWKSFSIL
jgi:hypothetical protein